jgi:hypothetical protein
VRRESRLAADLKITFMRGGLPPRRMPGGYVGTSA